MIFISEPSCGGRRQDSPVVRQVGVALAACVHARWANRLWIFKLAVIHFWLVTQYLQTATLRRLRSAPSFISGGAVGPITPHLFLLLNILCLAWRGAHAVFRGRKGSPITLCHPGGSHGPGNGRQECDDRTL